MKKNITRFNQLFEKYIHREYTLEERNEFLEMVAHEDYADILKKLISDEVNDAVANHEIDEDRANEIFNNIVKTAHDEEDLNIHHIHTSKKYRLKWWAAAILIISAGSIYFFSHYNTSKILANNVAKPKSLANDVAPGHSGAILTLSNGHKIVLDSLKNGLLANQSNVNILKNGNQISYRDKENSNGEILYNTMTTPKGRQYQLELSDGTKVWLDAASSITYPTAFTGKERKVEITGEVYFEVKTILLSSGKGHKKKMPFTVVINSSSKVKREIQVLGTHFNVNAYDNENAAKITLLEGIVKVFNNNTSVTIKPGEQAVMKNQGNQMSVVNADVNEAVAWKNGFFSFKNASIEAIMRQVERWYDVDVVYNGQKPTDHYGGEVSEDVNASEMLKVLEVGGIH
ncbi:MAG TPA: FecR domain-containing protein, partial [Hanamia sp.]|nr:FecR domain-containing protein [Hanamia sp.]